MKIATIFLVRKIRLGHAAKGMFVVAIVVTVISMHFALSSTEMEVRSRDSAPSTSSPKEIYKLTEEQSAFRIPEVDEFIRALFQNLTKSRSPCVWNRTELYSEFTKRLNSHRKVGAALTAYALNDNTSWERFYQGITEHALYDPAKDILPSVMKDLSNEGIVRAGASEKDRQMTLKLLYKTGGTAFMKPMRFAREEETSLDRLWFTEWERHNAEIAAFHLDRILGFNRALPSIGRVFNFTKEILPLLENVFPYISPAGNKCFVLWLDGRIHAIACAKGDMMEGSITLPLPHKAHVAALEHPWGRFRNLTKTEWETDNSYCETKIKTNLRYSQGRRLLDLVDLAIFDYLTGNKERQLYETFGQFGDSGFVLHKDNSKGFSNSQYDCQSCLAPLSQCCMIRQSTLAKLIKLYQGPEKLSQVMRKSLSSDAVSPVLWEPHLQALDRRIAKIIKAVSDCTTNDQVLQDIVIDDGVY